MEQKLNQLQAKIEADQSFVEKLFSLENPEEVQSLLKEEGLEFTLDEINMFREALVKTIAKGEGAELSDEDLEEVAGGIAFATLAAAGAVAGAIFTGGGFINTVTRGRW